jgi:hypothetical protein
VSTIEFVLIGAAIVGLIAAVFLLRQSFILARAGRNDPRARFGSGALGVCGLSIGLWSCSLLIGLLGRYVDSSWIAAIVVIAINLIVQPITLLFMYMGFRKLTLGVRRDVAYAWKRIPDEKLASFST